MKEEQTAKRIEALVDGYAELAEQATAACRVALDRLAESRAKLKQAERALEEIEAIEYPAARDVDNVVQVSALVARARIIARQALSSIRQTDLAEPPDTR